MSDKFANSCDVEVYFDHVRQAEHALSILATEIARRAGRSFPTMLLTGDTDRRRLIEAAACGFMMLRKPVEADELRRAVASLLRGMLGLRRADAMRRDCRQGGALTAFRNQWFVQPIPIVTIRPC